MEFISNANTVDKPFPMGLIETVSWLGTIANDSYDWQHEGRRWQDDPSPSNSTPKDALRQEGAAGGR